MKTCSRCGSSKELTTENFYYRQNRNYWEPVCRFCTSQADKDRYKEKRPGILSRNREYYEENRVAQMERSRAAPEKRRLAVARYRVSHPDRIAAHAAVKNSLRRGGIIPLPCEDEVLGGCRGRIEAHHDSYEPDKWLAVNWRCQKHHRAREQVTEEFSI